MQSQSGHRRNETSPKSKEVCRCSASEHFRKSPQISAVKKLRGGHVSPPSFFESFLNIVLLTADVVEDAYPSFPAMTQWVQAGVVPGICGPATIIL